MSKIGTWIYLKEILLNRIPLKTLGLSVKRKFDMHENAYRQFSQEKQDLNHISLIYTENTEPWKN